MAVLSTPAGNPGETPPDDPEAFLRGWRLDLARFLWLFAFFTGTIAYISGMPRSFAIASTLSEATRRRLVLMGIPPYATAWYLLILDTLTFALFATAALIIFRKRSTDPLALVTSFMLLFTGMLYTAPAYEARIPILFVAIGAAAAEVFQVFFLLIFPDGRFRPRWMWVILPPLAIWRIYIWRVYYIPWLYTGARIGDRYPFLRQDARDLLLFFAIVLVAVALQVVRYRRYSTPAQRLQAKWLVWATSVAVIVVGAYVVSVNTLPALHPRLGSNIVVGLAGRTVRQVALGIIPLALLYSVLRLRLWNIDFLINRTLVYVPLTSVLAGLFAVLASFSQRFMLATTGTKSEWAVVLITVLLATLVNPIRTEIQKWVDLRFKEAPDPMQALKVYHKEVRSVADILERGTLLTRLVDEAVRTLGACGGAVYAASAHGPQLLHATPAWYGPVVLQRPLVSGSECAGWLALGRKQSGVAYSEAEIARLDETLVSVALVVVLMYGSRSVETIPLGTDGWASDLDLPLPVRTEERVSPPEALPVHVPMPDKVQPEVV
jgi:hypothetical protein